MVTVTSAEAQNRFGHLLDTAQQETVEITRHGRPAAYVVSAREIAGLLEVQRRRREAVVEFEAWRRAKAKPGSPESSNLTDEEVNRIVHELR